MLTPSPGQLAWQRYGLGVFMHFGLNTFAAKEWSDGTLSPQLFQPTDFDADQWVRHVKSWGARYLILTAKHHDGFCLWPTTTTDYSVVSSPWRDGRGDVVGEVARACRRHGIGLGLYLSPWDRNAPCYDTDTYDDFYATQLTELCSNYGPLTEVWFDGAGSEGHVYDWPRYMQIVHELQPEAMVFNMGTPTIRWVGNEDGLAADPVEYVVSYTKMSNYTVVLAEFAEALYLPPECDVSLRRGWFWHPHEQPKTVEHLLAIYYRSIGLGCNLLLNVPPNRQGLLDASDVAAMDAWTAEVRRRFGRPIPSVLTARPGGYRAVFPADAKIDHLELHEDLTRGQRITGFAVRADQELLTSGRSVGIRRIERLAHSGAQSIEIDLTGDGGILDAVVGYDTGRASVPDIPVDYRASTEEPED